MRIFCTIWICLFGFIVQAQDNYQLDKVYTSEELAEDFEILVKSLKELHPAFYEFQSSQDFDGYEQEAKKAMIQGLTEEQFHLVVRKFIKEMGCGHTTALPSKEWYAYQNSDPKGIPLSVYILNDKIYIKDVGEDSLNIYRGREIVSINNHKSDEILDKMRSIQQRDGYNETFVNESVIRFFRVYYLFIFGRSEAYELAYKDADDKVEVLILEGGSRAIGKLDSKKAAFEGSGMRLFYDESQEDLAILDINSFNRKGYRKNYNYIFKDLEEKQIKHLVLDLRYNGGGFFPNGNRLLRYLLPNKFSMKFSRPKGLPEKNENTHMSFSNRMTKVLFGLMPDRVKSENERNHTINYKPIKKNHFNGKVYVLTNGGSFSMSGAVSTRLKHDGNALIIGTETGGGENGSYAIINNNLNLPNTKVRVIIPYYFMDHDVNPEQKGRGVIPDIIIQRTIQEMISDKDKELEMVINKIK